MRYKQVDPSYGNVMQFVGVYVRKWNPEWGEPTVGFIEDDYSLQDAVEDLEKLNLEPTYHNKVLQILHKVYK